MVVCGKPSPGMLDNGVVQQCPHVVRCLRNGFLSTTGGGTTVYTDCKYVATYVRIGDQRTLLNSRTGM